MAPVHDDAIDPIRARLAGHDLIRLADMLRATRLLLAFERGAHPALDQLDRVASACHGLSTRILTRRGAATPAAANAIIERILEGFDGWLPPGIRVEHHLPTEAIWLRASAVQLEEVVLALVANAFDAMPEGGAVTIRLEPVPGQAVARLIVEDRGRGLPASIQPRIFDPFFSTTGGVGLGLCGVRDVMSAVRGAVSVDSAIGAGTRIITEWPILPAPMSADVPAGRSRAILLVERDPAVRAALSTVLRHAGHAVTAAATVGHAAGWMERGGTVEVVVTDEPFAVRVPLLHLAAEGPEDAHTLRRPCHPDRLLARIAALTAGGGSPGRG